MQGNADGISALIGSQTDFNLTNGAFGINPVDPPGFGSWLSDKLGLPADFIVENGSYVNFVSLMYWSAIGLLLITLFCSIRLRDSRLGRAWIAIREDEVAAAAMGIPLMRTKTWSYASGAFFGGVAGAWYGSFKQGVFPDDFLFNFSIFILCMVILGGMGNVWGAIAGAAILTYLDKEGLSNVAGWFNEKDFVLFQCEPRLAGSDETDQRGLSERAPARNGYLRVHPRLSHALPTAGPHPRAAAAARDRGGRSRRAAHGRSARPGRVTSMSDLLLEIQALRKEFGGLVAVNDVDLTISRGSIVSLIGPNGAGKTTFFNMITGVYRPTAGRVVFDGRDIAGSPPHTATERGIGRTFQNIRLFQQMTALENTLVGMHCRLRGGILGSILGTPRVRREEREANERAAELLDYCGLAAVTTNTHGACRMAISGGSRSPAPSPRSPSSCSWTSRRQG